MLVWRLVAAAATAALVAVSGLHATAPASATSTSVPAYDHIFVVVMENHAYGEIVGSASAPYLNSLITTGALATSYYAIAHPSLPNYLALTGGSTFGIASDCTTCRVSAANLADRLEAAGSSWKTYQEGMPSACFIGDSYPYVQKHNPFLYFNNIRTNSSRCQGHIVPFTQLSTDLKSASTTPNFALITPDMCHDTHDCPVATGDSWLQSQVPAILGSPAFKTQSSLLVVTWDEDDASAGNRIPAVFVGANVKAGAQVATSYNHYSLLRTIETARGAATLTANDAGATLMDGMFASPPPPSPSPSPSPTPGQCMSVGVLATPSSIQVVGGAVTVAASASGCAAPQYQFWILAPGASAYALGQAYGSSGTMSWITSGLAAGTYRIAVWARDASSPGVYGNSSGRWDAYNASLLYTLNPGQCKGVAGSASPEAVAMRGMNITITASASGCPRPLYEFWLLAPGGTSYALAQPYSNASTFDWDTTGKALGSYRVSVWVRDASSAGASGNSSGRWDSYNGGLVQAVTAGCPAVRVASALSGSNLVLSATATGCPAPQFQFWVLAPGATTYTLAQAYSAGPTFTWSMAGRVAGTYRFTVWVRDTGSAGVSGNGMGRWDAYDNSTVITAG